MTGKSQFGSRKGGQHSAKLSAEESCSATQVQADRFRDKVTWTRVDRLKSFGDFLLLPSYHCNVLSKVDIDW